MKNKILEKTTDLLSKLTVILPLTICMTACSEIKFSISLIISLMASVIASFLESKKRMPVYISFLIIVYASNFINNLALLIGITLFLILAWYLIGYCDKTKKFFSEPVLSSAMIAGALYLTVMLTTDYFGIGAVGNTAKEMISSYISLGFHPNWRGVLYGTIVMVIMITFPRKFKKTTKIIDASFIALILTTIVNFFLNPPYMNSAIQELSFTRIPLHSCAVVLIVGAWQSVDWKSLKLCFNSPLNIICFAVTIISIMLFGIFHGMITTVFISIINYLLNKKLINS